MRDKPTNKAQPTTRKIMIILTGSFHFLSRILINKGININDILVWPEGNDLFPEGPSGRNQGVKFEKSKRSLYLILPVRFLVI